MDHMQNIPSIEESIELQNSFPSVVERYYTPRYCIDKCGKREDHLILFHTNRICLITLAPSHPTFKQEIAKIDFKIGNVDRTKNKVSGKGKKGGQFLHEDSILCKIICKNGDIYNVKSNIKGKLVEVNDNLVDDPSLFSKYPSAEGYLAIALPKIDMIDKWKDTFLTREQYENHLQSEM